MLTRWFHALLILGFAVWLAGCGGGDDAVAPPSEASATIGAAGGTLDGPDGVQLVVPAGALTQDTLIRIARTGVGAPTLPDGYTTSTPTYEFTPHGLNFNLPVTIRMPYAVPSGAAHADVFMATPGEDWQAVQATISNGVATWPRLSFSYTGGMICAIPINNTDPYICTRPALGVPLSATPATALALNIAGAVGQSALSAAATLHFTLNYFAPPDCANTRVRILRKNNAVGPATVVLDQAVVLAPLDALSVSGSTVFDVPMSDADNGNAWFGLSFSCTRPGNRTMSAGVAHNVSISIPATAGPGVTYAIGGTVSGLVGTGLVLQNNGGGDLNVAADGSFNFVAPVASGAAYAVTVQTQPTGQVCTVTNGSGTANADVANIGVSCVAALGSSFISGYADHTNKGPVDLANNGTDAITVRPDYSFQFPTQIADGATYNVTVLAPPAGQTCTVQNGTGIAPQAVGNQVKVVCVDLASGPLALVANSGSGNGSNGLSIYRANATSGVLSAIGNADTGSSPSAVAVLHNTNGSYAYVANFGSGSLSSFSIDSATGNLTPIPLGSPTTSSPYGIAVDPLGRFLWVVSYNGSPNNTVSAFSVGSNGALSASGAPLPTSSYARVVAVHPSGNFVFVASEISHDIKVYSANASNGTLTLLPGTMAYSVVTPNSMTFDPSGHYLYVADGSGSVVGFTVDVSNGFLSLPSYYAAPRQTTSVAVHPNGRYLYVVGNGDQDIWLYAIRANNGALEGLGTGTVSTGTGPQSIAIDSSGSHLYVTNGGSNDVSAFSISSADGTLTSLGATVPAGSAPQGIALTP
jgi:6-phosphogluconolactonase (cycloisomerase 2 family)